MSLTPGSAVTNRRIKQRRALRDPENQTGGRGPIMRLKRSARREQHSEVTPSLRECRALVTSRRRTVLTAFRSLRQRWRAPPQRHGYATRTDTHQLPSHKEGNTMTTVPLRTSSLIQSPSCLLQPLLTCHPPNPPSPGLHPTHSGLHPSLHLHLHP